MGRVINTNSETFGSVNQSAKTQSMTLRRYCSSDSGDDEQTHELAYSQSASPSSWTDSRTEFIPPTTDWRNKTYDLACDETYYWRARGRWYQSSVLQETKTTNTPGRTFKTHAVIPTIGTPSLSNETSSSVRVNGSWTPGTSETTAYCYVQYKKTANSTWLTFGGAVDTDTGYSSVSIPATTVTGLDSSTSYDFRLQVQRPGATNSTTYNGTAAATNTEAGNPTMTTNAATSVSHNSATLSATIVMNDATGVTLGFGYEDSQHDPCPQPCTSYANTSSTQLVVSDGTYTQQITGLTPSTTYYFRAIADWDSGGATTEDDPLGASELSFTTPGDPGELSRDQEMLPIQDFDRKWGVATTIFFVAPQDANSSSDSFLDAAVPWTTGDSKITGVVYDDDSTPTITAEDDTDSLPARVASTNLYRLDLSDTEMEHDEVFITLTTATPSSSGVRDVMLRVRTHLQLGTAHIDAATGEKSNATAFKVEGYGSGHGIEAIGGTSGQDINGIIREHFKDVGTCQTHPGGATIKLASTASSQDDAYNGDVVFIPEGTNAVGQGRVITDYNGTTKEATVDSAWVGTAPGTSEQYIVISGPRVWEQEISAELSSIPGATDSFGRKLQTLFQRFTFRISQTATEQTWYKADGTTTLDTRAVSDNGTTQLIEEF